MIITNCWSWMMSLMSSVTVLILLPISGMCPI